MTGLFLPDSAMVKHRGYEMITPQQRSVDETIIETMPKAYMNKFGQVMNHDEYHDCNMNKWFINGGWQDAIPLYTKEQVEGMK